MVARLGMLVEPFACPTRVAARCALTSTGNRSPPPKQSEVRNILPRTAILNCGLDEAMRKMSCTAGGELQRVTQILAQTRFGAVESVNIES
jgi:hypothetical protein